MKLRHVMIDLETMGTDSDSAIVSIGAVIFDPRYGKVSDQTFYKEMDAYRQKRYICVNTLEWWDKRSKKSREALKGTEILKHVLVEFGKWLPRDCRVWGNGALFDIGILENAYSQYDIPIPWKFYNVRDCRTIVDMYESSRGGLNKTVNLGGSHNALDDAIFQAKHITKLWNLLLKGGK